MALKSDCFNYPKVWDLLMKHLLGTKSGLLATPNEDEKPEEITWREETTGKLDLVVSFRFQNDSNTFIF